MLYREEDIKQYGYDGKSINEEDARVAAKYFHHMYGDDFVELFSGRGAMNS